TSSTKYGGFLASWTSKRLWLESTTGTSVAPSISAIPVQTQRSPRGDPGMSAKATALQTENVLRRIQGEFLEMPGLRLTEAQARRLWGLEAAFCKALLGALVDAKFLFRTRDGAFMRVEYAAPMKTKSDASVVAA